MVDQMVRRVSNHVLRRIRAGLIGERVGTVHQNWLARARAAAAPEPTPDQAAHEALLLHITHARGLAHPLGYETTGSLGPYTDAWLAPLKDQLWIGVTATRNWLNYLMSRVDEAKRRPGWPTLTLVDVGPAVLAVGFKDQLVWLVGPNDASVIAGRYDWHGANRAMRGVRSEIPKQIQPLLAHTRLRRHPTDRLLSALVRRLRLVDDYVREHAFFDVDGDLGLSLGGDPGSEPPELICGSPRERRTELTREYVNVKELLGIETARHLVEACFTNVALGTPRTRLLTSSRSDFTVVLDEDTGGRLAITWTADLW